MVTLDFPPHIGGIQKYLYGIVCNTYTKQDVVYVYGINNATKNHTTANGTKVFYRHVFFDSLNRKLSLVLFLIPYLYLCIRKKTAVIECGNVYSAFIPWLFFPVTKKKYHVYTYGTELVSLKKRSFKNIILKRILSNAKIIYTLGNYSKSLLSNINIHNNITIKPPRITIATQIRTSFKNDSKKSLSLLSIGRLVTHKGHDVLISAIKKTLPSVTVNLVIVGDGSQYKNLTALIKKENLSSNITLKRNLTDEQLQDEWLQTDYFIFPSLENNAGTEGFGIVLLEAMLHHVPVIASNTGGIGEVLDYGKCGLLVEPGNSDALAKAIISLWKDPKKTKQITQSAYTRLQENYVWK